MTSVMLNEGVIEQKHKEACWHCTKGMIIEGDHDDDDSATNSFNVLATSLSPPAIIFNKIIFIFVL